MSVLAVDAGSDGVTALVLHDDGTVLATVTHDVTVSEPHPGWVELSPDELWRAVLASVAEVLTVVDRTAVRGVAVTTEDATTVLWDTETLGSPRPALASGDRRTTGADLGTRARWLAAGEPHTWALVRSGRYAVGTLDSYLVARMTRGTWHLTDVSHAGTTGLLDPATGAWSEARREEAGLPGDALADVVTSWGEVARTEARTFGDLAVPVTAVVSRTSARLAALGAHRAGDVVLTSGPASTLVVLVEGAGTPASRSPDGVLTSTLTTTAPTSSPDDVHELVARLPTRPAVLLVDGDRAGDDRWCQDVAERTGLPVERTTGATPAVGAARLALLGAGVPVPDLQPPADRFSPQGPARP